MNGRAARERRLTEATATLAGVKAGDFVSWRASKGTGHGQVVSVHVASHVPGVPARVEGSSARPAAKVRLFAKATGGWAATDVHVGMHADKLTSIDPLALAPEPAAEGYAPGSLNALRLAVRDAITALLEQTVGMCPYVGLEDIGPDWVVYEVGNGMWMCSYTQADDGTITLDAPTQVVELTQWVPADGSGPGVVGVDEEEVVEPETVPMYMGEARSDTLTGRLIGAKGVDAATGGRVFAVEILRYGESKNGRNYPASVMQSGAAKYEGAKAFDHHRTDAELASSTVQGLVGTYRNVQAGASALEADLVLLPGATHTAEALDMALANAAGGHGTDPFVGISHDVMARYRAIAGAGGKQLVEATEIVSVNSADVVAHPAAGGQATRMVASQDPTTPPNPGGSMLTFKQLLTLLREADVAKRDALLVEHAPVLEAAGLDRGEALRMAEAIEAPAVTSAAPAAVGTLAGFMRRSVIREAVAAAKLPNADGVVDRLAARLPEACTEAQITGAVEDYRQVVEGLELAGLVPKVPDVKVTADERDKRVARLDAMFANTAGGYRSLKEAYADLMLDGRVSIDAEFAERIFHESIFVRGHEMYDSRRSTESLDSTSWAQIMGDSITRRVVVEYQRPELMNWDGVVATVGPAITDFRTQRITRMGGYGTLPAVAEAGTYQPLTSPGDEEATYAISKRGGTEDLTLEAIANDDLRAVQRIPMKLGLAAAQTLYRFVWSTCIAANPTCTYDSVALFHSSHTNTATNALTSAAINTARIAMRKQAGYGDSSDVLSIVPRTLITVPTLEHLAWQLVTSAVASPSGAPAGAASDIPNLHQGMNLVILDFYDATSTTAWFLAADPKVVPMIEIGFYQGRQQPELFTQADPTQSSTFSADKISYKIRHIYGGTVIDHRGLQRGNV